jgi:hypothetical protein
LCNEEFCITLGPTRKRTLRLRRPTGVLIAATVLGILTAFGLLGVLGSAAAALFIHAPSVPNLGVFKVTMTVFGLAGLCYCVFCGFVVAGLVQMRNWARISIVILGGLKVAFWGLMAVAMLGLRNRIPGTSSAAMPLHSAFWVVVALMYAFLAMIGLWWVAYFNLKSVRRSFKERNNESVAIEGSGICRYTFWHVVVIVLASFLLIGGLSTLAMTLMHAPFWFFGFSLRGTSAASVELIYAGVAIYCGIGLFRRSRMAFKTAIVLQVICLLSSCIALAPGATRQLWATSLEMNQRLGLAANPQFAESHSALIRIIQVFTLALISFWLYALFRCRNIFEGSKPSSHLSVAND